MTSGAQSEARRLTRRRQNLEGSENVAKARLRAVRFSAVKTLESFDSASSRGSAENRSSSWLVRTG